MNGDPDAPWWAQYLPLVIVAIAFAIRYKRLSRARPLRPKTMLAAPVVYVLIVVVMFVALPPTALGWLCFVAGLALGALFGWQRARLMRLHVDPDHGKVMVRQSPLGLLLLLALVVARRILLREVGGGVGTGGGGVPPAGLLYATDGGCGLALGMLGTQALLLWRRARMLIAEHRIDTFS